MLERDPEALERLEGCAQRPFEDRYSAWRGPMPVLRRGAASPVAAGIVRAAVSEVLNTSLASECAAAEFEAFWSLFEQRPDRPALNWTVKVRLRRVVELDFGQLEQLGVHRSDNTQPCGPSSGRRSGCLICPALAVFLVPCEKLWLWRLDGLQPNARVDRDAPSSWRTRGWVLGA